MLSAFDPTFLLALNLLGTVAFALSGAMAAVRAKLDIFGVLVLAGVVGLAGGIARDVMLGRQPEAPQDWRFLVAVVGAGLFVAVAHRTLALMQRPVDLLDAGGLAIFCVTGASVAQQQGSHSYTAVLLGMITAVGGGVVRDVLLTRVPTVLRSELYAIPALVGASILVVADELGGSAAIWPSLGMLACLGIRLIGMRFDLHLPRPSEGGG